MRTGLANQFAAMLAVVAIMGALLACSDLAFTRWSLGSGGGAMLVSAAAAAVLAISLAWAVAAKLTLLRHRLRRASARAELAERRLAKVAQAAGRDFQTPLQSLTLGTSRLLGGAALLSREARVVAHLAASAERLRRLISEVQGCALPIWSRAQPFTRLPDQEAEQVEIDLREVCADVLCELEAAYPDCPLFFEVIGDARGRWDRAGLSQVISNVVGSALLRVPKGSGVRLALEADGAVVALEVHHPPNPGAEEIRPMLENLRAGDELGAALSTGELELRLARQIVRRNGGELAVCSTEEGGTTFTVRLPRRVAAG